MKYLAKQMIRSQLKIFVLGLIFTSLLGCSKKDNSIAIPDGTNPTLPPIERPFGTPLGTPVVKEIGQEGGSLHSKDGIIQLNIPQGAVDRSVTFSIQEITNSLENGIGMAYRLLPENVKFNKPVEIIYDLEGTNIPEESFDLLFMTYQNSKGHHYLASDTQLDKLERKLYIKTTHFSDWSIVQLFDLEVSKEQVQLGDTTRIRLMWQMGNLLASLTTDQPIGQLIEYDLDAPAIRWQIGHGKGTIKAAGHTCIYTAPKVLPSENPAQISVTVPISRYTKKRNSVVMLSTPIYTSPDDQMVIKVDGVEMKNRAPDKSESYVYMDANNFLIWAQLDNGYGIGITIPMASGTGNYPFGSDAKQAYLEYVTDEPFPNSWLSEKTDCFECETVYSSGHVKIKKMGKIGDYVEGEFSGEIWRMGQYNPPRKKIEGTFRVFRDF